MYLERLSGGTQKMTVWRKAVRLRYISFLPGQASDGRIAAFGSMTNPTWPCSASRRSCLKCVMGCNWKRSSSNIWLAGICACALPAFFLPMFHAGSYVFLAGGCACALPALFPQMFHAGSCACELPVFLRGGSFVIHILLARISGPNVKDVVHNVLGACEMLCAPRRRYVTSKGIVCNAVSYQC